MLVLRSATSSPEQGWERTFWLTFHFLPPAGNVTEQTIVQGWGWGGLFREGERERKGEEKKKRRGNKIIATLLAHQDLASKYSRNSMSWAE